MHSTVTVGGLIGFVGLIIGILFLAYGAMTFFAESMSDDTSSPGQGFYVPVGAGLVLIGFSIWLIL